MTSAAPGQRFAQLTYSSFDRGYGTGGGWQVKDARGGLTQEEREYLASQVSTQFDWPVPVPRFPTPEEVEALPRRLVHGPVSRGGSAYWHTAPAGPDAAGRPGNVFAHVLLDRTPGAPDPALRPTDLWQAAHWLCPFGPIHVHEAGLEGVPDPPWGETDRHRAEVLDFLSGPGRSGVLQVLVDAVTAALDRGPPVVLGTSTARAGGMWIAAVSHLMSAGTSRRFHWSTSERAESLAYAWSRGLHLAVVPSGDLAQLAYHDGAVIIDENESPELGDLGDLDGPRPHRTAAGSEVTVTEWSVIVQVVLQSERPADVLALQDRIAVAMGDRDQDRPLHPAWPMAMAVVGLPDGLADAEQEAFALVARASPRGIEAKPALVEPISAFLARSVGPTTAGALAAVRGAGSESWLVRRLRTDLYLRRALDDVAWLTRPEGVDLPPTGIGPRPPEDALVAHAHRAILLAQQRAAEQAAVEPVVRSNPVAAAAAAVRLLDLTVRARLLDPADARQQQVTEAACRLVQGLVDPVLADVVLGPELARSVGPVAEMTQSVFVRPAVRRRLAGSNGRPGQRVAPAVLRWLYPVSPTSPRPEDLTPIRPPDPVLLELAAQVTHVVADPSSFRLLALTGVLMRLRDGEPAEPDLDHLLAGPVWSARDLRAAVAAFGPAVIARPVVRTLVSSPAGAELNDLIEELGRVPDQGPEHAVDVVFHAARMRYVAGGWSWDPAERARDRALELLSLMRELSATTLAEDIADIDAEVLASVLVAYIVQTICAPAIAATFTPLGPQLRQAGDRTRSTCGPVDMLCRCIDRAVLSDADVVVAALAGISDAIWAGSGPQVQLAALARFTSGNGESSEPLLDRVVRIRLQRRSLHNVREVADEVLTRVISRTREGRSTGRRDADRPLVDEAYVRQWWLGVGASEDDLPSLPRSRFRRS